MCNEASEILGGTEQHHSRAASLTAHGATTDCVAERGVVDCTAAKLDGLVILQVPVVKQNEIQWKTQSGLNSRPLVCLL